MNWAGSTWSLSSPKKPRSHLAELVRLTNVPIAALHVVEISLDCLFHSWLFNTVKSIKARLRAADTQSLPPFTGQTRLFLLLIPEHNKAFGP